MFRPGTPTIEQLRTFLAVVEEGSFAAAGRRLRRATSVVSYAIANLEGQLGLQLFTRQGTRKPQLTPEGEAVLAEVRRIEQGLMGLRSLAAGLGAGLEPRLTLVVDVLFPISCLAAALREFSTRFPAVDLTLRIEALGAVAELVLQGQAALGIAGPLASEFAGIERRLIASVELTPVAAPVHPLAQTGQLNPGTAREHVQLVLTDRSNLSEGREFSVFSPRTWRLGDLGAKHELLRQGLGWGNMPRWLVAEDLAEGRLVELALPEAPGAIYPLYAISRSDAMPGPAASWLAGRLAEMASIAPGGDLA